MHWTARHKTIMSLVDQHGSCSVSELTGRLGVSDETVRRDIKALAARGLLDKVHGGAIKPSTDSEDPLAARLRTNADAKQAIAARLARDIADGASLMLDTGSTTIFVARALCRHRGLFVVTNNGEIGRVLATGRGNRVYVVGGEIRGDDGAVFGETANAFLTHFRVDHAVLSAGGLDPQTGLTDFHLSEAEIARTMASRARRTTVVADHSKFSGPAPVAALSLDRIDAVVTDSEPPDAMVAAMTQSGIDLILAPPHGEADYRAEPRMTVRGQ